MDFITVRKRISEEAGMDRTQDDDIVKSWTNQIYQYVSGLFNWPWLVKNTILQTVADITTGTVSVNAGSTALTFSSAPSSSVANDYMIQFSTSDDWYYISSHTAGSTSATLSVAYTGSSNLSAGTYTLRKVFYSLASDLDRIMDIHQDITDNKINFVDIRTFDRIIPDPTATGTPVYYSLIGLDSSKNWRISFYPTPDAIANMQIRYYQRITELSSDSDEPLIPAKWHSVLVWGALAFHGHPFIDDTRTADAKNRFDRMIDDMVRHSNHVPDQMIVLQPWDTRTGMDTGPLRFPPEFDRYWSRY